MAVRFRVIVKNNFNLKKAVSALQKPTELMRSIGEIRRESFDRMIDTETSPSGKKLRSLSPEYTTRKKKKFGNRPKRVASGKTVGSYRQRVYGNRLIETIDSPIAGYLADMGLPLLPESFDELPSSEKMRIKEEVIEFLDRTIQL